MGADDQQERLKTIGWIVGLVDGEGCFSITIQRTPSMKTGWQVFPEFVVTQGEKSYAALETLKEFFGCGNIFINHRYDNHREKLYRYCVRAVKDLQSIIVPFFKENPPRTAKIDDFNKFVEILDLIREGKHLTIKGLQEIAEIAQTMNRKKQSRFLASSETIRRTSSKREDEDIVRTLWRQREADRNDQPATRVVSK